MDRNVKNIQTWSCDVYVSVQYKYFVISKNKNKSTKKKKKDRHNNKQDTRPNHIPQIKIAYSSHTGI